MTIARVIVDKSKFIERNVGFSKEIVVKVIPRINANISPKLAKSILLALNLLLNLVSL